MVLAIRGTATQAPTRNIYEQNQSAWWPQTTVIAVGLAPQCQFKNAKCLNCGKVGHIKRACCNKQFAGGSNHTEESRPSKQLPRKSTSGRNTVKTVQPLETESLEEYPLNQLTQNSGSKPIDLNVDVLGKSISMELDTGAAVSLISEETYKKSFPDVSLQESTVKLKSYSGEDIPVIGQMEVLVKYNRQEGNLPLLGRGVGTGPADPAVAGPIFCQNPQSKAFTSKATLCRSIIHRHC